MKQHLILLLSLVLLGKIYPQENITIFESDPNVIVIDIIAADDGIWLYKNDYNTSKSSIVKVNKDNEIISYGPQFDLIYLGKEVRFHQGFLSIDDNNNVYLYKFNSLFQDSSSISLLKINSNGNILWEQKINFNNAYEIISHGQIINNKLFCVGMRYKLDEEEYGAFAVMLSIDNGDLKWQKRYANQYFNVFADIASSNSNEAVILETGLDSLEQYYTDLVKIDTLGTITSRINLYGNFFGNRLALINDGKYLISGFGYEDDVNILKYNIKTNSFDFKIGLNSLWDDIDIPVFSYDNKYVSLHSTIGDPDLLPGSGVEIFIDAFDLNGKHIDSLVYDNDAIYESHLINAIKGENENIYFCGTLVKDSNVRGFWGFVDAKPLNNVHIGNSSSKIRLYPNIINSGGKVKFYSKLKFKNIFLTDISGNKIASLNTSLNSQSLNIPLVSSGIYFILFYSKEYSQIGKIIVK